MSFDLYLNCFGETEKTGLTREAVRSLFPIEEGSSEPDFWRVRYGNADSCEISVTPLANDRSRLNFFHVNRPCGDSRLWESLYQILRMGSVVLFFPGGPLILAQGNSASGLPPDMTESIGEPVYVDSGEAIVGIVREC
jgi:hypothetical protein